MGLVFTEDEELEMEQDAPYQRPAGKWRGGAGVDEEDDDDDDDGGIQMKLGPRK